MRENPPGLMVLGTDTGVGKTFVATLIARQLHTQGVRVGVYKPAASGCQRVGRQVVSEDAVALWEGAGQPLSLAEVCPQRFLAPLVPHLAAAAEGKRLDPRKMRRGFDVWREWAEFTIVEGAGGVLSPLGSDELVADFAAELDLPVLLVVPNRLGVVNQALLSQLACFVHGLTLVGVVLNEVHPPAFDDPSRPLNLAELARLLAVPILAHTSWQATRIRPRVDWRKVADIG